MARLLLPGRAVKFNIGFPVENPVTTLSVESMNLNIDAVQGISLTNPPSVGNAWDPPVPSSEVHISHSAANLSSALSASWTGVRKIWIDSGPTTASISGLAIPTWSNPNKSVIIEFTGGRSFTGTGSMTFAGTYTSQDPVSVSSSGGFTTLTFTSLNSSQVASKYPVNTIGKIFSAGRFYGQRSIIRRMGELAKITAVNGTTVTLDRFLWRQDATVSDFEIASGDSPPYSPSKTPHFSKLNSGGLWLIGCRRSATNNGGNYYTIVRLDNPVLIDCRVDESNTLNEFSAGMSWNNVYKGYVVDPQFTLGSRPYIVYGVSTGLGVTGSTFIRTDNSITNFTGWQGTVDVIDSGASTDPATATLAQISSSYGGAGDILLDNISSLSAARFLSTHNPAFRWTIQNVNAAQSSDNTAIVIHRGHEITYKNSTLTGRWIWQAYVECASSTVFLSAGGPDGHWRNTSDTTWDNCRIICNASFTGTNGIINVSPVGEDWTVITNLRYLSCIFDLEFSGARFLFSTRGTITMSNCTINVRSTFSSSIISVTRPAGQGSNSVLTIDNLILDLTNYPSSTGSLLLIDAGSNSSASGNVTVVNRPPLVTVTKSGNTAGVSISDRTASSIGDPVLAGQVQNTTGIINITAPSVPIGSTLFVAVSFQDLNNDASPTCADTGGNIYVLDKRIQSSTGRTEALLFRAPVTVSLVAGNTITLSGLGSASGRAFAGSAFYVVGLSASPVDQTAVGGTGTSTSPDSGNITTTQATEILVGVAAIAAGGSVTYTQDAQYSSTIPTIGTTGVNGGGGNDRTLMVGTRKLTATETNNYAPSISSSQVWCAALVSYKGA